MMMGNTLPMLDMDFFIIATATFGQGINVFR